VEPGALGTGLTRVVRALITERGDVEFASNPVKLPSGKRGRVDMVFSRALPESERTRHLVVELKRPMRLIMTEFGQVNNYASAITAHPEVVGTSHDWDLWLVGTEVDDAVQRPRATWPDHQQSPLPDLGRDLGTTAGPG
jgi:hypothetical protein